MQFQPALQNNVFFYSGDYCDGFSEWILHGEITKLIPETKERGRVHPGCPPTKSSAKWGAGRLVHFGGISIPDIMQLSSEPPCNLPTTLAGRPLDCSSLEFKFVGEFYIINHTASHQVSASKEQEESSITSHFQTLYFIVLVSVSTKPLDPLCWW